MKEVVLMLAKECLAGIHGVDWEDDCGIIIYFDDYLPCGQLPKPDEVVIYRLVLEEGTLVSSKYAMPTNQYNRYDHFERSDTYYSSIEFKELPKMMQYLAGMDKLILEVRYEAWSSGESWSSDESCLSIVVDDPSCHPVWSEIVMDIYGAEWGNYIPDYASEELIWVDIAWQIRYGACTINAMSEDLSDITTSFLNKASSQVEAKLAKIWRR